MAACELLESDEGGFVPDLGGAVGEGGGSQFFGVQQAHRSFIYSSCNYNWLGSKLNRTQANITGRSDCNNISTMKKILSSNHLQKLI